MNYQFLKKAKKVIGIISGSERPYKNCYGDFLVKLLNESSKQSTIIDTKTSVYSRSRLCY